MAVSKISLIPLFKKRLSSGDNLNNLIGDSATGFYYVGVGVANAPQDWTWLIVIGGSGTMQVGFSENKIFLRAYTGSPLLWTSWRQITF